MIIQTGHWLDHFYSRVTHRGRMFQDGWGDAQLLEEMLRRDRTLKVLPQIDVQWDDSQTRTNSFVRHGIFKSPCQEDGFPSESRTAYICYVRPRGKTRKALVVHLAATGEIGFKHRLLLMALPLARKGIGSIILENPYYGQRKPRDQNQHLVRTVYDLGMMFRATVMEGVALLRWAKGYEWEKLAISGCSMGGLAASITCALVGFPVALSAFLIPHSAVPIFTQGVLRRECDWSALKRTEKTEDAAVEKLTHFLQNIDLAAFPAPLYQEAAIIVNAKHDAFIPGNSGEIIQSLWPRSELRSVEGGHVRAFLRERPVFHQAIMDSLDRIPNQVPASSPKEAKRN